MKKQNIQKTPLNIVENLEGVFLITDKSAKVLYTNNAIQKKTGYSAPETIGKKPGELWGGNMHQPFYDVMWQSIALKNKAFVAEVKNKHKNKSTYKDAVRIFPVTNKNKTRKLYCTLQPQNITKSDEGKIKRDIEWIVQNQHTYPQESMGRILFWLSEKKIAKQLTENKTLFDILQNEFIQKTKQRFSRRSEDAAMIQDAQQNIDMFADLYEKYHSHVQSYFLYRVDYDQEVANDLTQDVFVKSVKALPNFRVINSSYLTYLLRIAHNILVNHYRKIKTDAERATPEKVIDIEKRIEQKDRIKTALESLTEYQKTVIDLKYNKRESIKKIAQTLKKSESAIKVQLLRARKQLKKELKK